MILELGIFCNPGGFQWGYNNYTMTIMLVLCSDYTLCTESFHWPVIRDIFNSGWFQIGRHSMSWMIVELCFWVGGGALVRARSFFPYAVCLVEFHVRRKYFKVAWIHHNRILSQNPEKHEIVRKDVLMFIGLEIWDLGFVIRDIGLVIRYVYDLI